MSDLEAAIDSGYEPGAVVKLARKINKTLATGEYVLVVVVLAAMTIASFMQVMLQLFFSFNISWVDEVLRHLVIWVGFLGAGLATVDDRHLTIDAVSRALPEKFKPVAKAINQVAGSVVCALLGYAAYKFVLYEWGYFDGEWFGAETFSSLELPIWVFVVVIPYMFFTSAARFVTFGLYGFYRIAIGQPIPVVDTTEGAEEFLARARERDSHLAEDEARFNADDDDVSGSAADIDANGANEDSGDDGKEAE